MKNYEVITWLLENGGPAVQFRTATELLDNSSKIDLEKLSDNLLEDKKVKLLLDRLDEYGPLTIIDMRTLNSIHSARGIEGIVAKLIEMGLNSRTPAFNTKMQIFRQYICNNFVEGALSAAAGYSVNNSRAIFIAVLLSSYFFRAGFEYYEIIDFFKKRIRLLYRAAHERNFDIFLDKIKLHYLPKPPIRWRYTPIICPEYDPGSCERPLPYIQDIFAMAYFPKDFLDNETKEMIDSIIKFVFEDRFQSLKGYGISWFEKSKNYYNNNCGWKPELPCLNNFDEPYEKNILLLYLDLMSHFKIARKSQWYRNCLDYLEQYRTSEGTYCFPSEYLKDIRGGVYVCGQSMGIDERCKSKKVFEIESTFRMFLLKNRN